MKIGGRCKNPPDHFEVLAIVSNMLVKNRFRPAVPALLRDARIVTDAVEAYA